MIKYVEIPKDKLEFCGNTEEEKKLNEMIYDLTLELDGLQQENEIYKATENFGRIQFVRKIAELQQENEQLKSSLEYLRSGEYYNQLRFERNMLENLVDNEKLTDEDKEFMNTLHTNTELLKENERLRKDYNKVVHESTEFESKLYELQENYERIYNENCILREKHNITDISLLEENN